MMVRGVFVSRRMHFRRFCLYNPPEKQYNKMI